MVIAIVALPALVIVVYLIGGGWRGTKACLEVGRARPCEQHASSAIDPTAYARRSTTCWLRRN